MHFKCMFVQTKNRLKAKFVCKADVPTIGPKRVTQPHPKERCARQHRFKPYCRIDTSCGNTGSRAAHAAGGILKSSGLRLRSASV
jgi:hypothetical protein